MLNNLRYSPQHSALMQHTTCISFTPTGVINEASPQFLNAMGYTLKEIKGQHLRIFCDAAEIGTRVLKENSVLVERTTHAMQQVVEQRKSSQAGVGEIETIVNEVLTGARSVSTSIEQLALEAS